MRILLVAVEGIEPPSVASSALMPALPAPAEGAQPPRALSRKGAHPLQSPLSGVRSLEV